MADIVKLTRPSASSILPDQQVTGLTAGEALDYFDAVYVKSDGKVWKATGAAANAAARVRGYTPGKHAAGDKNVTVYFGQVTVNYAAGLTPGADYYLSGATAGGIADAASTGGTAVIGFAVDATRVRFFGPR